jgi:hypothetical protein
MSKFIQHTETKRTKNGKLVIMLAAGRAEVGDVFGYIASSIPAEPGMTLRQRVQAERAAISAGHIIQVPKYRCVSLGAPFEFDGEQFQYAYVEAV